MPSKFSGLGPAYNSFQFNMKREKPVTYEMAKRDIDPFTRFLLLLKDLGVSVEYPSGMLVATWCWKYGRERKR